MGKKIIGNTLIFVFMMGFIVGFNMIFGSENTLIGVTTITAVLMFLEKDFSLNPVRTGIKLICFNVLMGVVTFIASKNAILGIPLNFIFVFIIGYTLCYNLSTPSFVPFNLQYVFMLFATVTIDQLPKRLISLIVGAILIMLSQIAFNKNKIYKQGNSIFSAICTNLIKKIELIEKGKPIKNLDDEIKDGIKKFRKFVYNKREEQFYFTDESKIKLSISLELEKINDAIDALAQEKNSINILNDENFKEDFLKAINLVKRCFDKGENINELDEIITNMFYKHNENTNISIFKIKVLNSLFFIKKSLYELKELDKKKYNFVSKLEEIPSNYRLKNIYKESFRSNSLRFSYAFRLAIGITVTSFIVDYFNIQEGRWIVYTVNSLIQPFYEKYEEKTKDRIIATVIGVAIISFSFYFVKSTIGRALLMVGVGYLLSYSNTYKVRTINATVSAIGGAALHDGNAVVLTLDRVLFVAIGTLISILLSKFVFPYKEEDARRDLINLYNKTIASQINILKNLIYKNEEADSSMKNEILRANMIEDKLLSNKLNEDDKNLQKYLEENRFILMDIYDLYNWVKVNDLNMSLYDSKKENIDKLVSDKEYISYSELEEIVNNSKYYYSLNDKIAIIDYIEILIGFNKIRRLKLQ